MKQIFVIIYFCIQVTCILCLQFFGSNSMNSRYEPGSLDMDNIPVPSIENIRDRDGVIDANLNAMEKRFPSSPRLPFHQFSDNNLASYASNNNDIHPNQPRQLIPLSKKRNSIFNNNVAFASNQNFQRSAHKRRVVGKTVHDPVNFASKSYDKGMYLGVSCLQGKKTKKNTNIHPKVFEPMHQSEKNVELFQRMITNLKEKKQNKRKRRVEDVYVEIVTNRTKLRYFVYSVIKNEFEDAMEEYVYLRQYFSTKLIFDESFSEDVAVAENIFLFIERLTDYNEQVDAFDAMIMKYMIDNTFYPNHVLVLLNFEIKRLLRNEHVTQYQSILWPKLSLILNDWADRIVLNSTLVNKIIDFTFNHEDALYYHVQNLTKISISKSKIIENYLSLELFLRKVSRSIESLIYLYGNLLPNLVKPNNIAEMQLRLIVGFRLKEKRDQHIGRLMTKTLEDYNNLLTSLPVWVRDLILNEVCIQNQLWYETIFESSDLKYDETKYYVFTNLDPVFIIQKDSWRIVPTFDGLKFRLKHNDKYLHSGHENISKNLQYRRVFVERDNAENYTKSLWNIKLFQNTSNSPINDYVILENVFFNEYLTSPVELLCAAIMKRHLYTITPPQKVGHNMHWKLVPCAQIVNKPSDLNLPGTESGSCFFNGYVPSEYDPFDRIFLPKKAPKS